ncbi:MAG TPA: hypothetical protein PKC73_14935 [Dermatophilaceae bacterium]|jgi:hypothetical protein|nr:hypothetical protein [Dermatophilaceae bacterium]HMT90922.1 hypothetical protein [Dermatophilaceae bacterium]
MNGRLQAIVNGYYVSLAPPARLNLSASRAESAGLGPDQTFEFIDLGGHRVALRSAATGKLVCAQDAGTAPLVCDRDEAREWETFELVDLGNSEYALRALVNNKYVCAENAGWDLLIANRDAVGSWETFRLVRLYEPDGLVHELEFVVQMGSDDLRGGRDNIDLLLTTSDGSSRHYPNINGGQTWAPGTWPRAYVVLDPPVAPEAIAQLTLTATVTGGIDGDNIDIHAITVTARDGARSWPVATVGAVRLTGTSRSLTIPVGHPTLLLKIATEDDDLRGGNDNLDVIVRRRVGADLTFHNVNAGQRWADGSIHELSLDLPDGTTAEDLREIVLRARVSGGWNGDNWTMDWLQGRLRTRQGDELIYQHGYQRFRGSSRELVIARS